MKRELVIILDFGGQYKQLIARRVRECNVYCEIHPHTMGIDEIRELADQVFPSLNEVLEFIK